MSGRPVIVVAIGDPNGIGPEIAVKAASRTPAGPRLVLVGDVHVLDHYRASSRLRAVAAASLPEPEAGTIDVIAVDALAADGFNPGVCGPASGRATVAYVAAALQARHDIAAAAVIACPHNETAVNAAGIKFAGYPGLVARLSGVSEDDVFLMLIGGGLRAVHVTLHERLTDALARIDEGLVTRAARAAHQALRQFGIPRPRIGLCGINPHAGEDGLFGDDDARITVPAAQSLRADGIDIEGPTGADVLMAARACDAYVVMYHDQGHVPVKLLAGRNSSALTIGEGIAFASVGHGSAPDIAGRGIADPEALIATIELLAGGRA